MAQKAKQPQSNKYLRYPSTPVRYNNMSFLIIDAPLDTSLPQYIQELRRYNAKHLVRACEPTYSSHQLSKSGIEIHELAFADGEPPPKKVIEQWLALVDEVFHVQRPKKEKGKRPSSREDLSSMDPSRNGSGAAEDPISPDEPCIAVHCQAGLGRAPALVAIALMERGGLDPLDAIMYIRERRKGAFNAKQMAYLEAYNSHRTAAPKCCVLC
mmetsp:Transcript_58245/g.103913  ORF Transcript_58245/g.103913 Transcript_58245/m.103913 type:complete len:212 (-) Transcript_58245:339-974(-)